MKTIIIVAISSNGIIGDRGGRPWHYSQDMKRFKRLTMDHPVVMGRKTFENDVGKPLKGRPNIVLTRNSAYKAPDGVKVCSSLEEARATCEVIGAEKMFVIGGAEIYDLALPETDEMEVTYIPKEVRGDTVFSEWDPSEWEAVKSRESEEGLRFVTYRRGQGGREMKNEK